MKKLVKVIGMMVTIVFILVALLFAGLFVNNQMVLKKEKRRIAPYGQTVLVDNQEMRVQVLGAGEETVVLLPGYLTGSPAFDFKLLTDELAQNNRVVVIEPFGYGQSADTTKKRSVENINSEIHKALQQLDIKSYTLMGHSISGVYALDYINLYPKEVTGFVGIDSSLPSQGDSENPTGLIAFLAKSGIYRILAKADPTFLNPPKLDDLSLEQFNLIALQNVGSKASMNEGKEMPNNFKKTQQMTYPKDLPVLYFLASESIASALNWLPIHEDILKDHKNGEIVQLEGSHYLHHTKAKEISDTFETFKKNNQ